MKTQPAAHCEHVSPSAERGFILYLLNVLYFLNLKVYAYDQRRTKSGTGSHHLRGG